MARKTTSGQATPNEKIAVAVNTTPSTAIQGELATDPIPHIKVNNANLAEIKSSLDEAVKGHLKSQSFTPSLLHPTVHLSLGYLSIIIGMGSYLWTMKMKFEESKYITWFGVSSYFILQGVIWAWKRWVERGEVFNGKRRRMVKRIETDIVQITSSTTLDPPSPPSITFSPHTRPTSPTSTPSSPSNHSPILPPAISTPATAPSTSSTNGKTYKQGPTYVLNLTLSTTSNNGKSLLHKARLINGRYVGEFVDVNGGVEVGVVKRWVGGLLAEAGLPGVEEGGKKDE